MRTARPDRESRALLAEDLRSVGSMTDGGHQHIEYYEDFGFLRKGSAPLVLTSPRGPAASVEPILGLDRGQRRWLRTRRRRGVGRGSASEIYWPHRAGALLANSDRSGCAPTTWSRRVEVVT
ncbi:Imm32 family immunity protein [Nocardia exalbida]|uniref:Imm32 family immunity protein n=1 Tax=Nocardia exalbida TaxID=290231 RepID=UPI00402BD81E